MILEKIIIKNYRSIKCLEIPIVKINNTKTYSFLGINESGKTSILKAIHLYDSENINFPLDFNDIEKPVEISFTYIIEEKDKIDIEESIKRKYDVPDNIFTQIRYDKVNILAQFAPEDSIKTFHEEVNFSSEVFKNHYLIDKEIVLDFDEEEQEYFNFKTFFKEHYSDHFYSNSHNVTFWKSSPEYLILEEIDLQDFCNSPSKVSVPLLNCFKLIDVKGQKLKQLIDKLSTPAQINNLQHKLSDVVTNHIKTIWPEHPIKLKFQISDNKISLLIEDDGVLYKVKTPNQRSDGFKQFISFLLTLSVQNQNKELSNTILLIDEPETHLHPPAQINLLQELIKITENDNNNLVFFATHSNYLIDKQNIDRCYKVFKTSNEITSIQQIEKKRTTYSEVNYEVFNIITNDYHNELYGYIEDTNKAKLNALTKDRDWINTKTNKIETVSLATYIRHSIHHPENTKNKAFTDEELGDSIQQLRKLKYK